MHLLKIWAANDIRIFVRMMTQRNVELQLQALDVIERRHFNSTASSSLDDPEVDNSMADSVIKQQSEEDTELDAVFQEEMKYNYLLFKKKKTNTISHMNARTYHSYRKSVVDEFTVKSDENDPEASTSENDAEQQVANKMQRLNLYFEKENVSQAILFNELIDLSICD